MANKSPSQTARTLRSPLPGLPGGRELREHERPIREWRGLSDKHVHVCRYNTYNGRYFRHAGVFQSFIDASLPVKQDITGVLHNGLGYSEKSLTERSDELFSIKKAAGETSVKAIYDCSPDIEGRAFKAGLKMQEKYGKDFIQLGAYPIFGFKDRNSDRHKHLQEIAPKAQFLVGLPERDERDGHSIGYEGHIALLYEIGVEHQLPIDIHVGQTNTPQEKAEMRTLEGIKWLSARVPENRRPKVRLVHAISLACQDDQYFKKVIELCLELGVEIVCCPHAAISMRQRRETTSPTHNSITRVLEFILAGVPVSFGTDNIMDLFMPLPDVPLVSREVELVASALRCYDRSVLYKMFSGQKLNHTDRQSIESALVPRNHMSEWSEMRSKF